MSTGDELLKRYKLPLTVDFLQLLSFLVPVYPTSGECSRLGILSRKAHHSNTPAPSAVGPDWTSVEQGLSHKFYEPDFTAVLTRFCESAITGDQVSLDEWQAYSQGLRDSVLPRMNVSGRLRCFYSPPQVYHSRDVCSSVWPSCAGRSKSEKRERGRTRHFVIHAELRKCS